MSRFYARDGAGDLLARYSFIEPLLPGKRVLEVGAASATSGASALFLAERGAAAVVSVEEDLEAIAEAARESQQPFVQFKAISIEALPERAFDLILCADGARLAADPARVAAFHRLLAPRGRLVTALPAADGKGLADLTGEPALGEQPSFESFVGALGDHFSFVEVATQSATVGYVVAMGQDAEPEISIDGSLAGTSATGWYVAICGEAPCELRGLTIVALPTDPLFEAAAARDALAAGGGEEAVAAQEALGSQLEAARKERDEAIAEADAARVEGEKQDSEIAALAAERAALLADRDAIAEARGESERRAAALGADLEPLKARVRELEGTLDAEREANFELRAETDRLQAVDAQRAREKEEAATTLEARAEENDAALRAARSEVQAAHAGLEAALARATTAEARTHELEESVESTTAATGAAGEELDRLRAVIEAREAEVAAARQEAAALSAELAAVRAEGGALAAERDALREKGEETRAATDALQARAAELEVRAAEVDRLSAELARRDDAVTEATGARDTLAAQVAELGARLETEEERLRQADARAAEAHALLEAARNEAAGGHREAVEQLKAELRDATAEREGLAQQAAEARNAADEAEAQAAELEAELQAVRWEKDETDARLQTAQASGTASSAGDVARLREEVALRTHRIVELEREVVRLGAVVEELTSHGGSASTSPAPADEERFEELERRLGEAQRRASEAEAIVAVRSGAADADAARALAQLKADRDSLQAQVAERDARLARMQREVVDKTERLGRLAKEMGELKAKGIGKLFK